MPMQQGLPTSFDNTATLADVAPALYGQQVGQQNQIAQDNNSALQAAFANEQAQQQKMNPLLLQNQEFTNQHLQSSTGYNNALSRASNLNSDIGDATKESTIGAANSKNSAGSAASKVAELESHGQIAGQVAAQLRGLPPGTPGFIQAQMVRSAMGKLLPNDTNIDKVMANTPDLADRLEQMSQQSYQMSSAARMEAAKEAAAQKRVSTQTDSAEKIASSKAASAERIAEQKTSLQTAITKSITGKDYAGASNGYAALAELTARESTISDDPDKKAQLLAQANYYGQQANALKQQDLAVKSAAAATPKGDSLNIPATAGLPAVNSAPPQAVPMPTPPGLTPSNVRPGGLGAQPAPPQAAIAHLMANPSLASAFDAKYGLGTSAALLKGK